MFAFSSTPKLCHVDHEPRQGPRPLQSSSSAVASYQTTVHRFQLRLLPLTQQLSMTRGEDHQVAQVRCCGVGSSRAGPRPCSPCQHPSPRPARAGARREVDLAQRRPARATTSSCSSSRWIRRLLYKHPYRTLGIGRLQVPLPRKRAGIMGGSPSAGGGLANFSWPAIHLVL